MRPEDGQSAANASRAGVAAQHSGAIQNSFADAGSADSTAMSRANAHAAKAKIVEYQDFQVRDPLRFQSIVTGQYSSAGTLTDVYHVITFTELVYDENHKPMLINTGDESKGYRRLVAANANADLKYGRAIIDGCFITGGKAIGDATDLIQQGITDGKSGYTLIDEYYSPANAGGAAIVPSYGHVRNCVVENNMAKTNGGALLLKPRALVSGCILLNNSAEGYGGAIYAYEPETANTASPLYIATHDYTADEYAQIDPSKDASRPSICAPRFRYANIFSSTIVGNSANAGGGVGFGTNLRMNSSVLWRNTANSEANINGELMAGKAEDETAPWEFPLQYCAVENERVPGYNNISVSSESSKGVRWNNSGTDEEILADKSFYYDLKKYSLLVRSGMLMNTYNTIRTA
ncbi:MAG: hypothetical protein HUK08_09760, partial [Bacteroidaceae bacterium]|nr:hypothetical protein [Bacteroidaceae bacterium]